MNLLYAYFYDSFPETISGVNLTIKMNEFTLYTHIYNTFPETISGINLTIEMNEFTLYIYIYIMKNCHSTHLFTSSLSSGHLQIWVNLL